MSFGCHSTHSITHFQFPSAIIYPSKILPQKLLKNLGRRAGCHEFSTGRKFSETTKNLSESLPQKNKWISSKNSGHFKRKISWFQPLPPWKPTKTIFNWKYIDSTGAFSASHVMIFGLVTFFTGCMRFFFKRGGKLGRAGWLLQGRLSPTSYTWGYNPISRVIIHCLMIGNRGWFVPCWFESGLGSRSGDL